MNQLYSFQTIWAKKKKAQLRIKFKGSPTAILLDISLLLQQVLIKKIFCIFLCLFFYFPTATDVHKG